MIKKYRLKTDPEESCFLCGDKSLIGFSLESLQFILELPLCMHHDEITRAALAKADREPGEEG